MYHAESIVTISSAAMENCLLSTSKYIPFVEKYHVEWHISDLKISILKIIHNSTLHAAIVLNTVGDDILQAAMFPKRILL